MANKKTMTVPTTLLADIVDYVGGSGAVLNKMAEAQKAFQSKISDTVSHLIDRGVTPESNREKLASILVEQPEKSLEYLCRLSDEISPRDLGGVEKTASTQSPGRDGYDGFRTRSKADEAFEQRLGVS